MIELDEVTARRVLAEIIAKLFPGEPINQSTVTYRVDLHMKEIARRDALWAEEVASLRAENEELRRELYQGHQPT